ncbi:unnamed protein product [Durusdinium trenchii]|uniref:Uncharacterized protein n=1 Tax=Durusdinium trenchii TaxID=1381693 RepID=A0ABP0MGN8_9DINO
MKQRSYGNAKFTALAQDGIDEDYFSDNYSGDESVWRSPWCWGGICLCCLCFTMLPLFVASFFLNSWATDAMEAAGLQTFGVPTTVDSVEISPLSARWSLANLRVASPPGFGEFPYLIIDNGIFDLSFRSMFFNPLYLEELTLRDVRLNWDQRVDGTSNGKTIMEHISAASKSAANKQFNDYLMTKQVIVDKITFFNIVTRLCLHPSCEMSPPPYFVIKKVEVNDVGKKTGGVYIPDLLHVIVQAVVVAAIKAAPNQLGNPVADSLGAGLLQALDYAQIHYDLGGGLQAASAQIGTQMGRLSRGTAALGQGVANTVESSEPQLIKALDQVLGLDHPTDATKKEVQKFVNQNAKAAAGNFASVVGNFSKVLSRGERDVGSNVSTVLAAMGEALENEKPEQPAPGAAPGTAAGTDLNDAASSAMKDVSTMIRSGEKAVSKMLKKQESSQSSFNPVSTFAHAFEQGQSEKPKSPLDVFAGMLRGAQTPAPSTAS